ncbi:MAG: hypothetical protein V4755_07625 [Curtobacterium sp.]
MTAFAPEIQPRHVDGKYAEYLSSLPERTLDDTDRHAAEISTFVGKTIGARAGRYRLRAEDVDDLRQEVMLQVLDAQQRRGKPLTLSDDGGLVRTMTRAVLSRGTETFSVHHRDRRAFGEWREEVEQLRLDGVTITKRVEDEVAERIRQKHPVRERPSVGFHEPPKVVSFDTPIGEDTTLGDVVPAAERTDAGFTTDTSAAARLAAARANKEVDSTVAKRAVWDAIADSRGAPTVAIGELSKSRAASNRKRVAAAGGPLAAAQAWEDGELAPADEQALFAPFGAELTNRDMEQVSAMLRAYPDYADELWGCAAALAVRGAVDDL